MFKNLLQKFKQTSLYKFLFILKHQPPKLTLGYFSTRNYYINDEVSVLSYPYNSSSVAIRSIISEYIKNNVSKKLNFLNAGCGDGLMRQVFTKSYFDECDLSIKDFFKTFNYYTNEIHNINFEECRLNQKIYLSDIKDYKKIDNLINLFPDNFVKEHLVGSLADKDFIKKYNQKRNYFDFIVLFDVLEHVVNPFNVIENIILMMKKNSSIIITVPFLQGYHEDPVDCFRYTHYGIKQLFTNYLIERKLGNDFDNFFKMKKCFYDISQRRQKDKNDYFYFNNIKIKDSYGGYRETWFLFCYIEKLF